MWWLLILLVPVVIYVLTTYGQIRIAKPCGACGKKEDVLE